ncbi:hypothetical protein JCM8547_006925 [Rhodosporidiobolus lusitaniae]
MSILVSTAPPAVHCALALQAFKACTTRRDLSTAIRAFSTAWAALEQVQVLSASCRRLGERAAEVLVGVVEVLKQLDDEEKAANASAGKVVIERSYEFRREANDDGTSGGGQGGATRFKIQSTMLDLQMFATDFLALSTTSRLSLLVDGLPAEQRKIQSFGATLSSCISLYGLSSPSTSSWAEKDEQDTSLDESSLPRLFQLSIALRGPTYEAFLADQSSPSLASETPAKRRTAFIDWCYTRNPMLKPKEGSPSPSTIRRGKPKVSWPPSEGEVVGLGLPKSLTEPPASPSPRRVVSQRAPSSPSPPSGAETSPTTVVPIPTPSSPSLEPTHASTPAPLVPQPDKLTKVAFSSAIEVSPASPPLQDEAASTGALESSSAEDAADSPTALEVPSLAPPPPTADSSALPDAPATTLDSSPSPSPVPIVDYTPAPIPISAPVLASKPSPSSSASDDEDDPEFSLARRDSSASSVAMTVSSSDGSRLFEPRLEVAREDGEERVAEQEEVEKESEQEEEAPIEVENPMEITDVKQAEEDKVEEKKAGELEEEKVEAEALPLAPVVDGQVAESLLGLEREEKEEAVERPVLPTITLSSEPEELDEAEAEAATEAFPPPSVPTIAKLDGKTIALPSPVVSAPSPPSPTFVVSPPQPADLSSPSPSHPLTPFRILSLDGGGLVGPIPQLLSLQQRFSPSFRPADHFDLIAGTSSSALLAVIFGHRGLSLADTLEAYSKIAEKAFPLELPRPQGASVRRKTKRSVWSRLFGGGGSSSPSPPPEETVENEAVRREKDLDQQLRLIGGDEPFSFSRRKGSCQVSILLFEKDSGATTERWISNHKDAVHDMTVGEVVKASLAASSTLPSPDWTSSPASLNPSSSAVSLAKSSLSSASTTRPISLLSLGTGYSSLSLDALSSKSISPTRISALREAKQLAASNAAAAASVVEKAKRDEGVEVERVELEVPSGTIERGDEWKVLLQAGAERTRPERGAQVLPSSRSSPHLSPPSSPPAKTVRKRLSFLSFGSNNNGNGSPSRRASSFVPSSSSGALPTSPLSPTLSLRPPSSPTVEVAPPPSSLAPPSRGLRTSVSLDDLTRRDFVSRSERGLYRLKEEAGSTGSLSG